MNFDNGVEFDPGFSRHLTSFSFNINNVNKGLAKLKTQNQKKFQYRSIFSQIVDLYNSNVAFYLGCLLWASYIKKRHFSAKIIGNPSFGKSFDLAELLYEVNFLTEYFSQFKKDCRYYLGQECEFEGNRISILTIYKDFLIINNGLTRAAVVSDILLPPQIKDISELDSEIILETIEDVVSCGDLLKLYGLYEKII